MLYTLRFYSGFQMSVYSFENKKSVLVRVLSFHFAYGEMKTQNYLAVLRGLGSAFTIKENLRIDKSLRECTAPTSNPLLDDKGD